MVKVLAVVFALVLVAVTLACDIGKSDYEKQQEKWRRESEQRMQSAQATERARPTPTPTPAPQLREGEAIALVKSGPKAPSGQGTWSGRWHSGEGYWEVSYTYKITALNVVCVYQWRVWDAREIVEQLGGRTCG
ncbi:MAG: hypothetical protein Q8O40_10925 [Chloroflexota bacterium]|nr:hypothetical protein [Chloroflexota bacterium]